jgi:hypothetical protein
MNRSRYDELMRETATKIEVMFTPPRMLLVALALLLPASIAVADAPNFEESVAPILMRRCLGCHSGADAKGRLDLSHEAGVLRGGESGEVIAAGEPDDSLLWQFVEGGEMPPKKPLPESEQQILRNWIAAGAKWNGGPLDPLKLTTDSRAGRDWWSLQPVKTITPPLAASLKAPARVRNPIDAFTLAKLEAKGLSFSPEADPRTLVRRLYYDLVGLPPEPEVVAAFIADPSSENYAALVDKLLASPHYGERWGRHWLDIARYGETHGFERNDPRYNAWPYRDWVIEALNADMPYDRFAQLQLAGDVLEPGPAGAAAVGFLVAGVHNTVVGQSERMQRLARQDELEEIAGAVGQTFLGLTINCARCHDHKFDPVTAREYYQFIAALDGVQHGEREVTGADATAQLVRVSESIQQIESSLAQIDAAARAKILQQRKQNPDQHAKSESPEPYAAWEFDEDLRDSRGRLHGEAHGGARVENGALVVDGRDAFVSTAPLAQPVAEKTLEAWVQLDNLDQRGGGVISLETLDGNVFDAIVFGEREPRRWMAGSNFFQRTQPFGGTDETTAVGEPVHVAIVYQRDGTITAYRNGVPYGKPYKTGFVEFAAEKSRVVFGLRHSPTGGNKMLSGKILRARFYDRALAADEVAASAGAATDFVSEKSIVAALSEEQRAARAKLKLQLGEAQAHATKLTASQKQKLYTVVAGNPGVMRVHVRGDVTQFGDEVVPAGVAAVGGAAADFGLAKNAPDAERRKQLAEWITHPTNPLFVRVMVNRVWHHHFGAGLVETPSDLGWSGGQPSHAELLDWLAGEFQRGGYRLKALHKLIVMSSTYRQASAMNQEAFAKDAGNRLLWRYSPRRVEAEYVHDAMLAVAGQLNPQRGGAGYIDVSITPNSGTTYYEPIDVSGPQFHRRSIYRFTPRGGRSAVLDTFDCPDPSSAAPRRSVTTTPLQALSLLNNSFVLKMADALAERAAQEAGGDKSAAIRRAWQLALCREPDDDELRLSETLVAKHGLAALGRALLNTNEFVVIE